jgi:hypothetical protein
VIPVATRAPPRAASAMAARPYFDGAVDATASPRLVDSRLAAPSDVSASSVGPFICRTASAACRPSTAPGIGNSSSVNCPVCKGAGWPRLPIWARRVRRASPSSFPFAKRAVGFLAVARARIGSIRCVTPGRVCAEARELQRQVRSHQSRCARRSLARWQQRVVPDRQLKQRQSERVDVDRRGRGRVARAIDDLECSHHRRLEQVLSPIDRRYAPSPENASDGEVGNRWNRLRLFRGSHGSSIAAVTRERPGTSSLEGHPYHPLPTQPIPSGRRPSSSKAETRWPGDP